jgi:muramoyltetrapeptide carboxypeptidase
MAMTSARRPGSQPRTEAGFLKFRPIRPGSTVALVAPASSFDRSEFEAGVAELRRLGLNPVYDDAVFERQAFTAGRPRVRTLSLLRAFDEMGADAVIAVRGGYGSVEILPLLDAERIRASRTAFVGYSDVTSLHSYLGSLGLASVHGPMIDGRLARGPEAYDPASFLASLGPAPLGELEPAGLETIQPGAGIGPLVGGTLTQLLASFETPFAFRPPDGHVLFLDEVGERPYRLHRMLMQLRLSGRLASASAVVFGQLPRCDEPGGAVTARDVVRDVMSGFPGPVLTGFPSGHTTTPLVSLPFGVRARVEAAPHRARLILEEAAAAD